jgi:hypothetical protein
MTCSQYKAKWGSNQIDCAIVTPAPCEYGNTVWECLNITCPYDNRYGVAYPFWCGVSENDPQKYAWYLMNKDGECWNGCPAKGTPTPTPYTPGPTDPCFQKAEGEVIQACVNFACMTDGSDNKYKWMRIKRICQNGRTHDVASNFTDACPKACYDKFTTLYDPPDYCNNINHPADADLPGICTGTGATPTPGGPTPTGPTATPANQCQLSNITPNLTAKCVQCIASKRSDVTNIAAPNCTPEQKIYHWCSGAMGNAAKDDCNRMKSDSAKCGDAKYECNLTPTSVPSATPTAKGPTPTWDPRNPTYTPTPTSSSSLTPTPPTVFFRSDIIISGERAGQADSASQNNKVFTVSIKRVSGAGDPGDLKYTGNEFVPPDANGKQQLDDAAQARRLQYLIDNFSTTETGNIFRATFSMAPQNLWCGIATTLEPIQIDITYNDIRNVITKKGEIVMNFEFNCQGGTRKGTITLLSGSSNEAFMRVFNDFYAGKLTRKDVIAFADQLTRTPSLQIQFCDVPKGECKIPI